MAQPAGQLQKDADQALQQRAWMLQRLQDFKARGCVLVESPPAQGSSAGLQGTQTSSRTSSDTSAETSSAQAQQACSAAARLR